MSGAAIPVAAPARLAPPERAEALATIAIDRVLAAPRVWEGSRG